MNELSHYGTPRHSGRYPWGSGDTPEQRCRSFMGRVDELRKQGLSKVEVARNLGIKTTELNARITIARAEIRGADYSRAIRLKEKGYGNTEIGRIMNINESSVRSLLNTSIKERTDITKNTANMLKDQLKKKEYLDIGAGVEAHLGITETKLKGAVALLKEDGYKVHYLKVEQLGTGNQTSLKILGKPESTWKELYKNQDKIRQVTDYSEDGGRSFLGLEPVKSVSSKRVLIKYDEDGGTLKDGVIELRRGVKDISLEGKSYAQVRIGVDDKYYMKGMAMYSDDIPKGYDMVYNSNKPKGTPENKVYKKMKTNKDGTIDEDNPFGATVRQKKYIDKDGKEKLSALNIVNSEGDWNEWSKTLSSQVLSKQSPKLAKELLEKAYNDKKKEFDEINALNNPIVKKTLMQAYADGADSAAVHLKAAALPRQAAHVILPFPGMKETEIYAPNYNNGERVALIRYPHGGIFEIPQLTVNNKYKVAKNLIGAAKDAVGINSKVAERLSGADFDGDTVLVIPNNTGKIKTSPPLEGLKNFDPKVSYPKYEGMPVMSSKKKQMEMGNVSNLITDMTIKGATPSELARAVRHSMCVIDAEKHELNYKQSFQDNGIAALKEKYQGSAKSGASTIISRASSDIRVNTRKETVDPKTGKKVFIDKNETYEQVKTITKPDGTKEYIPTGKIKNKLQSSTKMYEAEDARTLVGDRNNEMEMVYATHANKLKALANEARKQVVNTKPIPYSPAAKKEFKKEVEDLNNKLTEAMKNRPLERQAQIIANSKIKAKLDSNPHLDADDIKKLKSQSLAQARVTTGAQSPGVKKEGINITPREWMAIQSGAITTNVLSQILQYTDLDKIKQLATPRNNKGLTESQQRRIKALIAAGKTQAEIANALGVSTGAIIEFL